MLGNRTLCRFVRAIFNGGLTYSNHEHVVLFANGRALRSRLDTYGNSQSLWSQGFGCDLLERSELGSKCVTRFSQAPRLECRVVVDQRPHPVVVPEDELPESFHR
jgi:hypothetical protein